MFQNINYSVKAPRPTLTTAPDTEESALEPVVRLGILAFSANPSMIIGDDYPVKLSVGSKQNSGDVEDSAGVPDGTTVQRDFELGNWVCATLSAPNFSVQGDIKQCKSTENRTTTDWEWMVNPKEPVGTKRLRVTVDSYDRQNGRLLDGLGSKSVDIDVKLSTMSRMDRVQQNALKILGWLAALIAALTGVRVAIRKFLNPQSSPDKPSPG
jgi:hypothetical protein